LQKNFYQQQEMLIKIQEQRQEFKEEFEKQIKSQFNTLNDREESCRREIQKLEQEVEEEV
uniref:hypothetical protein n=1 Tax=Miniphocaeibacter massiliensis TaxID=2041841 RepID=UPI0013EA4EFE